jgi:TATA-binding protein-associated factor
MLYESFSNGKSNITQTVSTDTLASSQHIFQSLLYLRKVCNHPLLVLNSQHPKYNTIKKEFNEVLLL